MDIQKCCSNNSKENLADVFVFVPQLPQLAQKTSDRGRKKDMLARHVNENYVEPWIRCFVRFSTQKIGPICASPGGKMFRNPCNLPYFSYYFRNQKQLLIKAPPVQYYDRKKAMKAMNDSLKMWPIFRCRN